MKVAIVTGGSRGIGKSSAINLAKRGVGVVLTYNAHHEEAAAVASEIVRTGGRAVALKLDVTDVSSFGGFSERVAEALEKEWSRTTFDFLVNNAGTAQRTLIKDTTEEQFDRLTQVHSRARSS